MEGTGTGAAAMLVGSAEDVGGRPDAATITLEREEIEEALASDAPLDLILSVKAGDGEPRDMRVAWQRDDLETVLGKVAAGPRRSRSTAPSSTARSSTRTSRGTACARSCCSSRPRRPRPR